MKLCKQCGKEIKKIIIKGRYHKPRRNQKFCSKKCYNKFYNIVDRYEKCVICKKKFKLKNGYNTKVCRECKRIGKQNGKSKQFEILKEKIKIKYNNTCQDCGIDLLTIKSNLRHVHHVDFNKYNDTEKNLTLLCFNCHIKRHKIKIN